MTRRFPQLVVWTVCAASVLGACGSSDGEAASGGRRATVTFEYVAATSTDPAVAAQFPDCVQGVAGTHLHPSWRGFDRVDLASAGDRWTVTLGDVPVGTRERIRLNDPNACADHATGATTRDVLANGVPLADVVDTPGAGVEPGLAFTVAEDGAVTP